MAEHLLLTIDLEKYAKSDVKMSVGSRFKAGEHEGTVTSINLTTGHAIVELDAPKN